MKDKAKTPETKTIEQINENNASFWAKEEELFRKRAEKYPLDLEEAANRAATLTRKGLGNDIDFLQDTSLHCAMKSADAKRSNDQSLKAKGKRPKKSETVQSIVVNAMRLARNNGNTLQDFIDSATNGSLDRIEIDREDDKYTITILHTEGDTSTIPEKTVSKSTLGGWFTEAGRKATPK